MSQAREQKSHSEKSFALSSRTVKRNHKPRVIPTITAHSPVWNLSPWGGPMEVDEAPGYILVLHSAVSTVRRLSVLGIHHVWSE